MIGFHSPELKIKFSAFRTWCLQVRTVLKMGGRLRTRQLIVSRPFGVRTEGVLFYLMSPAQIWDIFETKSIAVFPKQETSSALWSVAGSMTLLRSKTKNQIDSERTEPRCVLWTSKGAVSFPFPENTGTCVRKRPGFTNLIVFSRITGFRAKAKIHQRQLDPERTKQDDSGTSNDSVWFPFLVTGTCVWKTQVCTEIFVFFTEQGLL